MSLSDVSRPETPPPPESTTMDVDGVAVNGAKIDLDAKPALDVDMELKPALVNGDNKAELGTEPPAPIDPPNPSRPTLSEPKASPPFDPPKPEKPSLADLFDDEPPRSRGGSARADRRGVRFDLPDEAGPSSPRSRSRSRSPYSSPTSPHSHGTSRETTPNGTEVLAHDGARRKVARGRRRTDSPAVPVGPPLIADLPLAWEPALETFESLDRCVYERKDLGLSREQDEMMVCDCSFDPDDPDDQPCGPESDCINRIMFIECLAGECKAGKRCRNQRLARRQYAPVDVVQTEKKGFGLRAREDIPAGALVYEYIGEVVVEKTFRKRMAEYADEGIKHFYFMMLQKEEYIDATKKGGIGRFANHSCNPNCEVQKWVVGRRMRMGIFTKRDVKKDEEITFNYNVDRYGHEAQICYCGEPNCVGTIGGKTQTDIGGMDDLFLEALGILDEVNSGGMKGNRKKKARHLDEDYVPILTPITDPAQANKVSAAMRQSVENPTMLGRLLERVKLTDDPAVHRQLMRMHGFSLMAMILTSPQDRSIVLSALRCMEKWRTQIRNKIEDSGIEEPIKALAAGDDAELAEIAKRLLEYWSTLELSYRIPRRSKISSLDDDDARDTTTIAEANAAPRRPLRPVDDLANTDTINFQLAPVRYRPIAPPVPWHRPARREPPPPPPRAPSQSHDRSKLDAIIALAQQSHASPATPSVPDEPRKRQKRDHHDRDRDHHRDRDRDREHRHRDREHRHRERDPAVEEARKEKRLTKAIGEVVVRSMSKYKDQMEHDTFKRYAKDCTGILVEKEKRGHSYQSQRVPTLSEEKQAKIKAFTKEFTHKVLRNLKAKGKLRKPGSSRCSTGGGGGGNASGSQSELVTPGSTPALTLPSSASTPSQNGTGSGTGQATGQLLDEMFGEDDKISVGSGRTPQTPLDTPRDTDGSSRDTPRDTPREFGTPKDFGTPRDLGTPREPHSVSPHSKTSPLISSFASPAASPSTLPSFAIPTAPAAVRAAPLGPAAAAVPLGPAAMTQAQAVPVAPPATVGAVGAVPTPPSAPLSQRQPVMQDRFVAIKQPPTGPRAMMGNVNPQQQKPILVDRVGNVRLGGERK